MLAVDLTSEEVSVVYILSVSCKLLCINWNEPHVRSLGFMTVEWEIFIFWVC